MYGVAPPFEIKPQDDGEQAPKRQKTVANVDQAAQQGKGLLEHLAGVCFMGGAVGLGNQNSACEFNAATDPEAAKIVIESFGPRLRNLVMVPLDVTHTALFGADTVDELAKIGAK